MRAGALGGEERGRERDIGLADPIVAESVVLASYRGPEPVVPPGIF